MKTTTNQPSSALYEQMGIAALLPGMQRSYELLGREIAEMRERLGMLQHSGPKRGRPPINREAAPPVADEVFKKRSNGSASYWAGLSPEQRRKEMIRRQKVGAARKAAAAKAESKVKELPKKGGKKPAKPRIYDPAHPGNKAWLAKMSRLAKKRWAQVPKGTHRLQPGAIKAVKHVNGVAA